VFIWASKEKSLAHKGRKTQINSRKIIKKDPIHKKVKDSAVRQKK